MLSHNVEIVLWQQITVTSFHPRPMYMLLSITLEWTCPAVGVFERQRLNTEETFAGYGTERWWNQTEMRMDKRYAVVFSAIRRCSGDSSMKAPQLPTHRGALPTGIAELAMMRQISRRKTVIFSCFLSPFDSSTQIAFDALTYWNFENSLQIKSWAEIVGTISSVRLNSNQLAITQRKWIQKHTEGKLQ